MAPRLNAPKASNPKPPISITDFYGGTLKPAAATAPKEGEAKAVESATQAGLVSPQFGKSLAAQPGEFIDIVKSTPKSLFNYFGSFIGLGLGQPSEFAKKSGLGWAQNIPLLGFPLSKAAAEQATSFKETAKDIWYGYRGGGFPTYDEKTGKWVDNPNEKTDRITQALREGRPIGGLIIEDIGNISIVGSLFTRGFKYKAAATEQKFEQATKKAKESATTHEAAAFDEMARDYAEQAKKWRERQASAQKFKRATEKVAAAPIYAYTMPYKASKWAAKSSGRYVAEHLRAAADKAEAAGEQSVAQRNRRTADILGRIFGTPVKDADGNPVYQTDENGNSRPVYVERGAVNDWATERVRKIEARVSKIRREGITMFTKPFAHDQVNPETGDLWGPLTPDEEAAAFAIRNGRSRLLMFVQDAMPEMSTEELMRMGSRSHDIGFNLTEEGARLAMAFERGQLDEVRARRLSQFVSQLDGYVEQYLGMPARKGEGTARWDPRKREYVRDPLQPYQDMPVPEFDRLRAALRAHVDGQDLADYMDEFERLGGLEMPVDHVDRVNFIAAILDNAPDDVAGNLSIWPAKERNRISEILAIREELGQRGATNVVGRPFPPDGPGSAPEPLTEDPTTGLPTVDDILARRLPGQLPRSSMAYMKRSLQKLSKLRGRAAKLMEETISAEIAADVLERQLIKMRLRVQEIDGFWLNRLGRQVFPNKKGELPKSAKRIPGLLEEARRARDEQLAIYERMVAEQAESTVIDNVVVTKETIAQNVETLDKTVSNLEATQEGAAQAVAEIVALMDEIEQVRGALLAQLDEEGVDQAAIRQALEADMADIPEAGTLDLKLPDEFDGTQSYFNQLQDLSLKFLDFYRIGEEDIPSALAALENLADDARRNGVDPEDIASIQEQIDKLERIGQDAQDNYVALEDQFLEIVADTIRTLEDLTTAQKQTLLKAIQRKLLELRSFNTLQFVYRSDTGIRGDELQARKVVGGLQVEQNVRDFAGDKTAFDVNVDPVLQATIVRHRGVLYEIRRTPFAYNNSVEVVRLNPMAGADDPFYQAVTVYKGAANSLDKTFDRGRRKQLPFQPGGHLVEPLKVGWPQKQIFSAIAKDIAEIEAQTAKRKGGAKSLDAELAKQNALLNEMRAAISERSGRQDSFEKATQQIRELTNILEEAFGLIRDAVEQEGVVVEGNKYATYDTPRTLADIEGGKTYPLAGLERQINKIDDAIAIYDRTGVFPGDELNIIRELDENVSSNPADINQPEYDPARAQEMRELALNIREQLVLLAEQAIVEAPASTKAAVAKAVTDGKNAAAKPDPTNPRQYRDLGGGVKEFNTGTRTYRITPQLRPIKAGAKSTRQAKDYIVQRVASDGLPIESTTLVFKSIKGYQKYIAESISIDESLANRSDVPIDRPALMPPRGPVWSKDLLDAEARLAKLEGERVSLLRGARRQEVRLEKLRVSAAKARALAERTDAASKRLEARLGREVVTQPGLTQVGLSAAKFDPEIGARVRPNDILLEQTKSVDESLPEEKVRAEAEKVAASLAQGNLSRRGRVPIAMAMRAAMSRPRQYIDTVDGKDIYVYGSGYVPARSPRTGEAGPKRIFSEGLTGYLRLGRQRYRTGEYSEIYNMRDLIKTVVSEQRRMNQNEAIFALMNSSFALTANELLGEELLNNIADESFVFVRDDIQAYKAGRMDRDAYFEQRLREEIGRRIRIEMENRGWRTNPGEYTDITQDVPDSYISGESRFLPRYVVEAVARKTTFIDPGAAGLYLTAVRKGTTLFKNLTLPLSITWQLGDVISTFMLSAMTDVPISELIKQMRKAYDENYGGGFKEIFREETDRTVGQLGKFIGESGLQDVGLRLEERALLEEIPIEQQAPVLQRIPVLGVVPRGYAKFREASYRFNEFTNRIGRQAYFMARLNDALESYNRRTGENVTLDRIALMRLDETNAEIHRLFWDTINQANDVMGDWMDLSAFERRIVMPHITFYAWIKHINKLFFRIANDDPAKIMWYMYLGQMAYDPDTDPFGIFGGAVSSFFGNSLARIDFAGPFSDVVTGPIASFIAPILGGKAEESTIEPLFGMVSPVPRLLAASLGRSMRGGLSELQRPPGQQVLNRQGRPISPQLIAPSRSRVSEMIGTTIDTFPLLRKVADLMPTGQIPGTDVQLGPYKTYETGYARTRPGTNMLVEKPGGRLGGLLNLFNVPFRPSMTKQQAEEEELAALRATTNAAKQQARLKALAEFQGG